MRLAAPNKAPQLHMTDVQGRPVLLGGNSRRTLICFFRDAACPFCNMRVYLLTNRYDDLAQRGLSVIALFNSSAEAVKHFVANHPRPFPVIADPDGAAYAAYQVERSLWRKVKAIVTRLPTLLRALRRVGIAGLNTNNIVPADFLVDEAGNIVDAHYGRDAGDHIPFQRIEAFADAGVQHSGLRIGDASAAPGHAGPASRPAPPGSTGAAHTPVGTPSRQRVAGNPT